MKRPSEETNRAVFGDILKATTIEQRAWIGAVVLIFNETETGLHKLAGSCLGIIGIGDPYAVTARVNGSLGLVAIVFEVAAALQLAELQSSLFKAALSEHGFQHLKKLRDSVIHSVLADSATQIAIAPGGRGERQDVLLSESALEGLYKRLVFLEREIHQLDLIIKNAKAIKGYDLFGALDDQRRSRIEQDIQDATALCQSHQQKRLSLPPFPKFPDPLTQTDILRQWLTSDDLNKSMTIRGDG